MWVLKVETRLFLVKALKGEVTANVVVIKEMKAMLLMIRYQPRLYPPAYIFKAHV